MKTKITADSTCDLPVDLQQKYDVTIMPLYVSLGEKNLVDGVSISPEDIYEYYAYTKKLPKSAARSQADYFDFFKQFTDDGYAIVHFCVSESMSVSYHNALEASKQFDNVYVVNTESLSTGMALQVLYACDLVAEGATAEEVFTKVKKRIPAVQASFILNNLEFLYKGGRCSSLAYLGANMLGIKPSIEVHDGAMGVGKKYIGRFARCLRKYVEDTFEKFDNPDKRRCFVTHTKMDPELVEQVVEMIKQKGIFNEILETTAGCTITTHCGESTLGVLYINDGGEN